MMTDKGLDVQVEGVIPEEPTLRFTTTGPMGGDAGHGSNATLEIVVDGGAYQVDVDKDQHGDIRRVAFTAMGDWEIHGLETTIVKLAHEVISRRLGLSWGDDDDDQQG